QLRGKPSVTRDGRQVELAGNIGSPKDIEVLKKGDAEGVGLFRTEFIYMNRETLPSEEEQFECYREVLSSVHSKPVIIRTLDIGGDKSLPYLDMPKEMNPFLGYRAIRICLDQVDLFKTQLRAMLRASVYGNLNIMFPMISSLEELLAAKKILAETASELRAKGVQIAEKIPVGIMIEIPSAAMMADVLAKNCDFFSIGTNDLIQYTCAVDRMNEKIHDLYNSYHPGVLRLVNKVIQDAHSAGIWAGMCGEVAGELPLVPVLLGMGLDEFSMSPNSILKVRRLIHSLNYAETQTLAKQVLQCSTSQEVEQMTQKFLSEKMD
ncbi:phosphoenolpyruvate--protein phosphotransferase, partial [bacterium]|nr:phosphoenolpyruvate--protein phosphotransferase [bacterium]